MGNNEISRSKNLSIVGASGAVGVEFISVLEKLKFPVNNIKFLASSRSAGKTVSFQGEEHVIEELTKDSFKGTDIALFSAGSGISKQYEKDVLDAGAVIVDNSSAFRMRKDVPLIVPEVNPEDAKNHNGIIANPNCSTIIMLMAVYPLHAKYPVEKIIVSTYQAASGAGWEAMEELRISSEHKLQGKKFEPKIMPFDYAFNTFSHNSNIDESGYNEEERKMVFETKKILHNSDIGVSATCIRVPVFRAHSESIHLVFKDKSPSVEEARKLYTDFPGIDLVDDPQTNHFPMPIESSEKYNCLVGRIRKDISNPAQAMELFVSGDQLLKGAALNAVQIAQLL